MTVGPRQSQRDTKRKREPESSPSLTSFGMLEEKIIIEREIKKEERVRAGEIERERRREKLRAKKERE